MRSGVYSQNRRNCRQSGDCERLDRRAGRLWTSGEGHVDLTVRTRQKDSREIDRFQSEILSGNKRCRNLFRWLAANHPNTSGEETLAWAEGRENGVRKKSACAEEAEREQQNRSTHAADSIIKYE